MTERRKLQRSRTYLGASIAYGDKRSTLDCLVRNLTAEGALLATPNTTAVPEVFNLVLPSKAQSFFGKAVWREEKRVGVRFLGPGELIQAPMALEREPSASGTYAIPLELARKLRNCEKERAELKRRIAELSEPG